MGQLYILKLRGRKWYVGYTDRAITRILQHAEKKGAKWTKKHPPVNPIPYWMSEPGYSKDDENRKTLELMGKHGIANVRGGDWCMVNMHKKTYRELEAMIGWGPFERSFSKSQSIIKDFVFTKRDLI